MVGEYLPQPARDGVKHFWGFLEMDYEACRPEGASGIKLVEGTKMALLYPDATGYVLGMLYEHRPGIGYPRSWTAPMDDLPAWLRETCKMQTETKLLTLPNRQRVEVTEQVLVFPHRELLPNVYQPIFAARWWEIKMGKRELTDKSF